MPIKPWVQEYRYQEFSFHMKLRVEKLKEENNRSGVMQNLGNACMFWNILLALIKVVEMQLPYTHSIINSLLLCLI